MNIFISLVLLSSINDVLVLSEDTLAINYIHKQFQSLLTQALPIIKNDTCREQLKKEYNNIVCDIQNNYINFENFPFLSERLLNSLKNIAKAYKKQDLIDQIISIQIVNKLTNNDTKMDVW